MTNNPFRRSGRRTRVPAFNATVVSIGEIRILASQSSILENPQKSEISTRLKSARVLRLRFLLKALINANNMSDRNKWFLALPCREVSIKNETNVKLSENLKCKSLHTGSRELIKAYGNKHPCTVPTAIQFIFF